MAGKKRVHHYPLILRPDPARTVIRPFEPGDPDPFVVAGQPRTKRIADRVLAMHDAELADEKVRVTDALDTRHRDVDAMLLRRFEEVAPTLGTDTSRIDRSRALLIGAYFCEEYSYEAAALFNPSIVAHPDQSGVAEGSVRFVMSLRGIGEGHVSSVTFRTGIWPVGAVPEVDVPSGTSVAPIIKTSDDPNSTIVDLQCGGSREISETVLFPITPSQRQGIEDLRLVQFSEDDGTQRYLGTYTAFSGAEARSEMLSSTDFTSFEMRPLTGDVAASKGMALFPRRIGGRYAMLGRQDNENIWFIESDDFYDWNGGTIIVRPQFPWEFVQIGNCGSPIEIEEGWLMLTHGVGTVRNYCMGATLLDRDDPTKVLARTPLPIIAPSAKQRDGYVPNVVYSCGALVRDRTLLLPYGVADDFASFASITIDDLLALMK